MKGVVKTLFFLSSFGTAFAHAGIYMCKDAAGRTLTSDRPIPECADRTVREYGNNGVLKREISPPLTAAQKREKALEQQKRHAEVAAAEEQRRADRALAARYRSEGDIDTARKRDSATVTEQIAQQKAELASAEKEWKKAQAAVEAQRKKGSVPAAMQATLTQSLENARVRKKALHESEDNLAQINAKYDAVLQRYRDIATASAQ